MFRAEPKPRPLFLCVKSPEFSLKNMSAEFSLISSLRNDALYIEGNIGFMATFRWDRILDAATRIGCSGSKFTCCSIVYNVAIWGMRLYFSSAGESDLSVVIQGFTEVLRIIMSWIESVTTGSRLNLSGLNFMVTFLENWRWWHWKFTCFSYWGPWYVSIGEGIELFLLWFIGVIIGLS